MARAALSDICTGYFTSVSAEPVPLREFRLTGKEASLVEGLEANGSPKKFMPPLDSDQLAVDLTPAKKRKIKSKKAKNKVGTVAQEQITAVPPNVFVCDNMPRTTILEPCTGKYSSSLADDVPLHEFNLPKEQKPLIIKLLYSLNTTRKLHPSLETEAQSKPATHWYPTCDPDLTTMTDTINLQRLEKSISTIEFKLSSVEENLVAIKEQMTELKDHLARMRLENTETRRTVLDLMELARTEFQKKTIEAEEGSIPIPGSKEVSSSTDSVQHQAPEVPEKPHPEVSNLETPAQSTPEKDADEITLLINKGKFQIEEEDTFICKSILNEYSMKMNAEKPIYNSETAYGIPPAFVTSLTFSGRQYVGAKGRSKKESQQLAARAVILSILDSDACTVISMIITKWRLSSAKDKIKYPCSTSNEIMPEGIPKESNVGISLSNGNKLDNNMPRVSISELIENSTSVPAISVPFHEFKLPIEATSDVESNGTPVIYAPPNLEQLDVKSTSAEKGKCNFMRTKNDVGINAQVCIAAVTSSQTCTVPQSVPDNYILLQGFDNAVSPRPCVLPKLGSGCETHMLVYWRKPAEGFYALNTDGAFKNGIAAGGGILRNHIGEHIFNFYNNYGNGSCIIAESKAILDGLSICKELGYNNIQIQTDSLQATLCFGRQSKNPLSLQIIWDEIYKFQETLSVEIMHVHREGNKMADYLSKKGILANEMGAIDMCLDKRAKEILTGEMLGISYLKKLKNQFVDGGRGNFLHTGVQGSAMQLSQISTSTVPNNCVSLQVTGLDKDVLCGTWDPPKLRSGFETHFLVYWRKPPEGFIALNTRVSHSSSGIAVVGGVLRNHNGQHISNFYSNYGRVSIDFAKSKAILDGLLVCKELGYNKIQIQTDSAHTTLWFQRQLTVTVPLDLQTMWNEIYKFQDTLSIEILHVYREGNKLAEHLSKKGILAEGMVSINFSLDERAREVLVGEKLGLSYHRILKDQCTP